MTPAYPDKTEAAVVRRPPPGFALTVDGLAVDGGVLVRGDGLAEPAHALPAVDEGV